MAVSVPASTPRTARRSLRVEIVRRALLAQVWLTTLGLRRALLLGAAALVVVAVVAWPMLAGIVPLGQRECTGSAEGLGIKAIIGSDGCVLAGIPIADPDLSLEPASNIPLAFPQQVVEVPAPAPEPVVEADPAAAQPASQQQSRAVRRTTTAPPAAPPAPQGPPPPEIAVQLFRQLGLPLPELLPNGTFKSDGGGTAQPQVNQSTGGTGAPSSVTIDGTLNGNPVSSNPPAAPPAPPASPPFGQGGLGSTASGTPGQPPS